MLSFLLLGFLLGLRHALEADHLAAITALNDAGSSLGSAVRRGITWGAGHTATLLAVGAVCLFARWTPPPRFEQGLEMGVGAMLVVLGIGVLRRLRRERIVWRPHRHADGQRHLHAHRHTPAAPHRHARDRSGGLRRASIVGMVHGLAGSAALVLLVLPVFTSPWHGVAYIALFGLGSILGMTILSAVIALPLNLAHRSAAARAVLQTAVGWSTLACGAWVFWSTSPAYLVLRIGLTTLAVAGAYAWVKSWGGGPHWSALTQLGRTSLFIYWIHVELVYGLISRPWHRGLTLVRAFIAYVIFCGLMLACSIAKERIAERFARPATGPRELAALSAAPVPTRSRPSAE